MRWQCTRVAANRPRSLRPSKHRISVKRQGPPTMQERAKSTLSSEFDVVGSRPIRPDGWDKVTGRARFGADLNMPGQIHGFVLRSPHPHAKHQEHRHVGCDGARGRQGHRHARRSARAEQRQFRRRRGLGQLPLHDPQRAGARKGAVRRPCGCSRRCNECRHRQEGVEADQGRLRDPAARARCRGGDGTRRAAAARRSDHGGRQACANDAIEYGRARGIRVR